MSVNISRGRPAHTPDTLQVHPLSSKIEWTNQRHFYCFLLLLIYNDINNYYCYNVIITIITITKQFIIVLNPIRHLYVIAQLKHCLLAAKSIGHFRVPKTLTFKIENELYLLENEN